MRIRLWQPEPWRKTLADLFAFAMFWVQLCVLLELVLMFGLGMTEKSLPLPLFGLGWAGCWGLAMVIIFGGRRLTYWMHCVIRGK